ncbi:MAG: lysophospholipid acyltransferase family protein [Bdellovibrionales bacterium]|nr:lysophospholipid acyltransferase family protein [Bdellovibrionales bacterium]
MFYRTLSATWRITVVESEDLKTAVRENKQYILAIWHGDELVLISQTKKYLPCTMTSQSKDGELMTYVLHKLGMMTSRGSSSRGAISGLKGLLRLAKSGRHPVMAVDGPRGPYHVIKPGVFEVAKLLNAEVFAAGVSVSKALVFKKAWNKAYLPHPFARVVITWSNAFQLSKGQDVHSTEIQQDLHQKFDAAAQKARELCLAGDSAQC